LFRVQGRRRFQVSGVRCQEEEGKVSGVRCQEGKERFQVSGQKKVSGFGCQVSGFRVD
jgi:hypothetical protein